MYMHIYIYIFKQPNIMLSYQSKALNSIIRVLGITLFQPKKVGIGVAFFSFEGKVTRKSREITRMSYESDH